MLPITSWGETGRESLLLIVKNVHVLINFEQLLNYYKYD